MNLSLLRSHPFNTIILHAQFLSEMADITYFRLDDSALTLVKESIFEGSTVDALKEGGRRNDPNALLMLPN